MVVKMCASGMVMYSEEKKLFESFSILFLFGRKVGQVLQVDSYVRYDH